MEKKDEMKEKAAGHSPMSFDMISLTTGVLAGAWLSFAVMLKKRLPRSEEQVAQ